MRHHREAGAFIGAISVTGVIESAKVNQLLELERRVIAQQLGNNQPICSCDFNRQLTQPLGRFLDALSEHRLQSSLQRFK